jgi:hypothetical protein
VSVTDVTVPEAPKPPPKPPAHAPTPAELAELTELTETEPAVTSVACVGCACWVCWLIDGAPEEPEVTGRTVTQAPTVTAAFVAGTDFVIAVDLVQVTAVCDVVFCTCMVVPETAAIVPRVPGRRWPAPNVREPRPLGVEVADEPVDPAPHALRSGTEMSAPRMIGTTGTRREVGLSTITHS